MGVNRSPRAYLVLSWSLHEQRRLPWITTEEDEEGEEEEGEGEGEGVHGAHSVTIDLHVHIAHTRTSFQSRHAPQHRVAAPPQ